MSNTVYWGTQLDTANLFSKKSARTLELEIIKADTFHSKETPTGFPSTTRCLNADGETGTSWTWRDVESTIRGLGTAGYLSTIPMVGFNNAYISTLLLSTNTLTLNFLNLSNGSIPSYRESNSARTTLYTDGTISTHSMVVYGSNTLYLQGNFTLQDLALGGLSQLAALSNIWWLDGKGPLFLYGSNVLPSTVASLGSLNYISSLSVQSTITSLQSNILPATLFSTLIGLNTAGYI
jgi:hypothetical protein